MSLRTPRSARTLALCAVALLGLRLGGACRFGPVRVLLIGDSITAGAVSEPSGPAYAELLAESLGPDFEIFVASCRGATTVDWLPSAPVRLCSRRVSETPFNLYRTFVEPVLPVEIAVIALGTNDFTGHGRPRVSLEQYAAALRELAGLLRAGGASRIVLVKPPPAYHRHPVFERLLQASGQLEQICGSLEGVVCGPDLMRLLSRSDFERGNAHPNASGHARIAAALAEQLRELAAEL